MKTKRSVYSMVVAVVAALAGGGCGAPGDELGSEAQALDTAPLVARPTSVDLGAVAVGSTATQRVTLFNSGRDEVDVAEVTFSSAFPPDPCRAVVIQPCIRPGESTTLELSCTPSAVGPFGGRVAIAYHSSAGDRVLSVSVTGQAARSAR
mgnify:CR=1 FL=1